MVCLQLGIAELFNSTKHNISKHIKTIFDNEELIEKVVVNYQLTTTQHGSIPRLITTPKQILSKLFKIKFIMLFMVIWQLRLFIIKLIVRKSM